MITWSTLAKPHLPTEEGAVWAAILSNSMRSYRLYLRYDDSEAGAGPILALRHQEAGSIVAASQS